ncbi:DapH/DapD/GlmU-related protein [Intestinimonas timonensis]|uniref:DapH/DapD/GlmU-related protein n=1 Tax=Intestinimonas timonensis TaxID=1689270 RepID=UPI003A8E9AC1
MGSMGAIVFLPREDDTPSLMLQDILFDPACTWLSAALERAGVGRFLVVCHGDDQAAAEGCFPAGTQFVTEGAGDAAGRLSAFLSDLEGSVLVFTRPVFLDDQGAGRLTGRFDGGLPRGEDAGVYAVDAQALCSAMEAGGDFLTAVRTQGGVFGVTPGTYEGLLPLDRCAPTWDSAQYFARHASVDRLSEAAVRFIDKEQAYIGPRVQVGGGTVILPGTILRGNTVIGQRCEIGPNTMIRDCTIGDEVTVNASQLNESTVDDGTNVGPFAYVRPNCHVGKNVKVGDFVELKNSTIGDGTKISHLTYVGDTDAGAHINFGCGTVTVNYDGTAKFRTTIGDNAFIGCNTNLVAPVKIGDGAYTAAGSTVTEDVPADSLCIARSPQTIKVQWAAKRRRAKGKK